MKITDAKVLVCCPGRNFLTLKIYTDEGMYGLGDATLKWPGTAGWPVLNRPRDSLSHRARPVPN